MADFLKKYKLVIAVVLPILILVLFRSLSGNYFKNDAKRWAEPSVSRLNIITGEQSGNLSGNRLLINLDKKVGEFNEISKDAQIIPAESILIKKYLNIIRKHKGPVLLYSSETGVSARIWMILSQMGYKNIYILSNDADNEVFKNKFRPDTLNRPEF
ncbi:MAG: hypothetical protein WCS03_15345 [Bacteroidota bacterium]